MLFLTLPGRDHAGDFFALGVAFGLERRPLLRRHATRDQKHGRHAEHTHCLVHFVPQASQSQKFI